MISKMAGVQGVLLLFPARLPNLASVLALLLACDLISFGYYEALIWDLEIFLPWSTNSPSVTPSLYHKSMTYRTADLISPDDYYGNGFDDRPDFDEDVLPMTDDEFDAKFGPDFDDVFAPVDGTTDDIKLDTEQQFGWPVRNDCQFCHGEVSDGTWIVGSPFVCDECYSTIDEPRTCSLCDAIGHGYPGAGPCPLEDRGWDDRPDREMFTFQADL